MLKTRLLVLLPLAAACTFPDVLLGGGDGGAPGTTASTGTSTTTSGEPSSTSTADTSTASTGGGDGGAASTASAGGDGGGGSTSDGGGGSTSGGGGAGGGPVDPGGDGECPVGTQGAGCRYRAAEGGGGPGGAGGSGGGSVDDGDCDGDGTRNADDCHPCNPAIPSDAFHEEPYVRLDDVQSWDWNCSGGAEVDFDFKANGCAGDSGACDAAQYYIANPVCGQSTSYQTCKTTGFLVYSCSSTGTLNKVVACR